MKEYMKFLLCFDNSLANDRKKTYIYLGGVVAIRDFAAETVSLRKAGGS